MPLVCRQPPALSGAATLPSGFSEALVASGLASPTAMQFAPDGRLFSAEQGGKLRVVIRRLLAVTEP
jgi:glucose/arabinose dehydrogenase